MIVGEPYYRARLNWFKKRFHRSRRDTRAFKKALKRAEFFEKHAEKFHFVFSISERKKTLKCFKIKEEEDPEEESRLFISVPIDYFPRGKRFDPSKWAEAYSVAA
jgi:hypothetical protein